MLRSQIETYLPSLFVLMWVMASVPSVPTRICIKKEIFERTRKEILVFFVKLVDDNIVTGNVD